MRRPPPSRRAALRWPRSTSVPSPPDAVWVVAVERQVAARVLARPTIGDDPLAAALDHLAARLRATPELLAVHISRTIVSSRSTSLHRHPPGARHDHCRRPVSPHAAASAVAARTPATVGPAEPPLAGPARGRRRAGRAGRHRRDRHRGLAGGPGGRYVARVPRRRLPVRRLAAAVRRHRSRWWWSPWCCGGASAPTSPSRWCGWPAWSAPHCSPTARAWSSIAARRGSGRSRSPTCSPSASWPSRSSAFERRYRAKRAKVPELNDYLATAATDRAPADRAATRTPWTSSCCAGASAFAHQPDDGLTGLDWGEQFHSGTQLRYQLNALCWALSLYAANFVPNATGQLEEALAKLIEKHTDLRVWRYWRTLNLLGNFDPNPDPIVRDNIMLSAFLGDVLNIYEAATGSTRFDQPRLAHVRVEGRPDVRVRPPLDRRRGASATSSAAGSASSRASRAGRSPCATSWAPSRLFGHDTLHGTDGWERVRPRWVQTLDEEYSTPDGSYAHIRSNHVGLSWDTGEVPGGHYFAAGSNRFADILPEHARRAAALERRGAEGKIAQAGGDGARRSARPRAAGRAGASPGAAKRAGGVERRHRRVPGMVGGTRARRWPRWTPPPASAQPGSAGPIDRSTPACRPSAGT